MSTTKSTLKRAAKAFTDALGAQRYGVRGKPFVCRMCGHDRFKLEGGALSITGYYTLVCAECSHIELFAHVPPTIESRERGR